MLKLHATALCALLLLASGCQEQPAETEPGSAQTQAAVTQSEPPPKTAGPATPPPEERTPPRPPILENFQGTPRISLFPRIGDFRPEDKERLPFWQTFIDHLIKVTGVAEDQSSGNRAWSFRPIKTLDSAGYFAPLAVEPGTRYTVSFKLQSDMPEEASAGIGILEYNEFLWFGEQYTESTHNAHYRGVIEGRRLTGKNDFEEEQSFSFTTGPETRMIHLILYREGAHDRNSVMFDDIRVE